MENEEKSFTPWRSSNPETVSSGVKKKSERADELAAPNYSYQYFFATA